MPNKNLLSEENSVRMADPVVPEEPLVKVFLRENYHKLLEKSHVKQFRHKLLTKKTSGESHHVEKVKFRDIFEIQNTEDENEWRLAPHSKEWTDILDVAVNWDHLSVSLVIDVPEKNEPIRVNIFNWFRDNKELIERCKTANSQVMLDFDLLESESFEIDIFYDRTSNKFGGFVKPATTM